MPTRVVILILSSAVVSTVLVASTVSALGVPPAAQAALSPSGNLNAPTPMAVPTAPDPASGAGNAQGSAAGAAIPNITFAHLPVYNAFDFLRAYLDNSTAPILTDAKPWDNSSLNFHEYQQPGGGTSYWDYWPATESWNSPNHLWRDDNGNWHNSSSETVKDSNGQDAVAYILVDRAGPGVMDKLWFAHDAVHAVFGLLNFVEPAELTDWGDLARLGNLRIEVDGRVAYDGPIIHWFDGSAQQVTPAVQQILMWRYRQFGSTGSILPIPYQTHIKISTYGGQDKPKWFMATGMTFPEGTRVKGYDSQSLAVDQMDSLAQNVLHPEEYLKSLPNQRSVDWALGASTPMVMAFQGEGTLAALQLKIPKQSDLKSIHLKVQYGDEVGIDLPLLAFFSEPGHVSVHHSTPIGLIESGDSYLLYSNLPMPYQNGMTIQMSSDSKAPTTLNVQTATTDQALDTQLRTLYDPGQQLPVYGPNYDLHIDGGGKLVGLVLQTSGSNTALVPRVRSKGKDEDPDKYVWPMGYLEGNLTLSDGAGNQRFYSGQEDWAEGGFYFNLGYTTVSGGGNRPFAGILRYKQADDGYATLFRYFNDLSTFPYKNGLDLSFGHGTWNNHFSVTYAATVFYYHQVPGMTATQLPASDQITVQEQAENSSPR